MSIYFKIITLIHELPLIESDFLQRLLHFSVRENNFHPFSLSLPELPPLYFVVICVFEFTSLRIADNVQMHSRPFSIFLFFHTSNVFSRLKLVSFQFNFFYRLKFFMHSLKFK